MFRLRTSHWTWSAIIIVVLVFLAAMQILRVNSRRPSAPAEEAVFYTEKGSLVNETVGIPAGEFYLKRLDLNRRARLTGTFRTSNLKNRVNAFVIEEKFFEGWKRNATVPALARTGSVPGGKVNLVLGPGRFLLLLDNREGDQPQNVAADFLLE